MRKVTARQEINSCQLHTNSSIGGSGTFAAYVCASITLDLSDSQELVSSGTTGSHNPKAQAEAAVSTRRRG